jgi:hypothetical protein
VKQQKMKDYYNSKPFGAIKLTQFFQFQFKIKRNIKTTPSGFLIIMFDAIEPYVDDGLMIYVCEGLVTFKIS